MDAAKTGTVAASGRNWLAGLLLVGLILRIAAAWYSEGIIHPDEHQQYLEQGFRLVHGYGAVFWEQERGTRHPLIPTILAAALWTCEQMGVSDPRTQAAVLRLLVALSAYAAMAYLAWTVWHRGQQMAGLVLAFLLASSVDLLFMQVRVLSETVAMVPLALALVWWPRRPALGGLALGLMVALRLQTAPFALGLWTAAVWMDWRRSGSLVTVRLTAGVVLALLAAGLHDLAYYGSFGHSAVANLSAQLVHDGANQFGVSPPDRYLSHGAVLLLRASVFAGALLLWGAWRRRDLALPVILFVLAHTLISHKEVRFLWPLTPVVCLLVAVAVEDLVQRGWLRRWAVLACLAVSVLLPSGIRVFGMPWSEKVYVCSARALTEIGRRDDVQGVAVLGIPRCYCGNYFYLQRPVPITCVPPGLPFALDQQPDWSRMNYLIAPKGSLPASVQAETSVIAQFGTWCVYRRTESRQQRP